MEGQDPSMEVIAHMDNARGSHTSQMNINLVGLISGIL